MKIKIVSMVILSVVFATASLFAETRNLPGGQTIGDGKNGRTYSKWSANLGDEQVNRVTVRLRKKSGGNDAYVNLRFGDGQTFENGKREYLADNSSRSVSWNVGGQRSGGQPLMLLAYNGEVIVESVSVDIQDKKPVLPDYGNRPGQGGNRPIYPPNGGSGSNLGNYDEAYKTCRRMYRIAYPRVEIGRLNPSGNIFSGDQRASGSIYGQCIQEAGYFEYGQLKEKIDFPLSDRFERRNFSVKMRSNRNAEIRVYTTDGQEAIARVD